MTIEKKIKRNKKMFAEYCELIKTEPPTKTYKALAKKYGLEWVPVMRIVRRMKAEQEQETNFSS